MLFLRKIHCLYTIIIFIANGYCFDAFSQAALKFRHYSINDGLSGSYINCVYQDSLGFIWIATDNGIDRYDGYTFVNYSDIFCKSLKIKQSLFIRSINEGHDGYLFFGTTRGIIVYDVIHRSHKLIDTSKQKSIYISNNAVYDIYIDREGVVWAGTWDGLDRLDFKSNTCSYFRVDSHNRYAYNAVIRIKEDKNGNLWVATRDGGVASFNKKKNTFTHYRNLKEDNFSIPANRIKDLHIDQDGEIWVATWGVGLCHFDPLENKFYSYNLNSVSRSIPNINGIVHDSEGMLWIATEKGIEKINKVTGEILYIQENPANPTGLSSNVVVSVYADRQKGLWFGTSSSGINYLSPYNNKFQVIQLPEVPSSVCQDSNRNYWFGTEKGIYILDGNQKNISGKYPDVLNRNIRNISVIVCDRFNNIWVSSNSSLCQFNAYGKFIRRIDYQAAFNDNKPPRVITDIEIDEEADGVWLDLTGAGLAFYDLKNKRTTLYEKNGNMPLSDNRIADMLLDKNNNLWVTVAHTLQYKSSKESRFLPSPPVKGNSRLISNENNSLFEDSNGDIWIGTESSGLQKYNPATGHLTIFTHPHIPKYINGIVEDKQKNIWLTSKYGLINYNRHDGSFKIYSVNDGIPSNIFLSNKAFKSIDGSLIFITDKGSFIVKPDAIPTDRSIPKITFTGIWVNNQEISVYDDIDIRPVKLNKDINSIEELSLNYRQSDITIDFSALSFANPSENHYKYKLIGLQSGWIDLNRSHRINFSSLSPGKYILQIIGSNNDGIWNNEGKKLIIVISPPWWNTWWFRMGMFFIIAVAVYLFIRIRMASLRKQKEILEKTVKERTREIASQKQEIEIQADNLKEINLLLKENQEEILQQKEEIIVQAEKLSVTNKMLKNLNDTKDKLFSIIAHDLKNPFHAISGLSEVLLKEYSGYSIEEQLQNIRMIKDSSDGAAVLLENLLQWALIQTDKANFTPVPIYVSEIVESCLKIYKVNAKNKDIRLVFDNTGDYIVFADRNMTMTIVRNLVNNAIKFTPREGRIIIKLQENEDSVAISVTDTGIGMSENTLRNLFKIAKNQSTSGTEGEKGTGLGLILCKEFAERNNGMLKVTSKVGEGSTFILQLPVGKAGMKSLPEKEDEIKVEAVKLQTLQPEEEPDKTNKKDPPLILIVDDSSELRQSISQNLRKYYRTIEAVDGKDGISLAFKTIPDLVISDIMMPEMNGYQVCEVLKDDERTSHIPVILLTAKTGDESKIEGYKTGAEDYLNKPFPQDVLIARVNNLLESRRRLRERFLKEKHYDAYKLAETSHDQAFLQRAFDLVEKNLMNEEFDNDAFIKQMNMSRAQLYRKLRALTNQSVSDFIKTLRLKKAAFLIENTDKRINEIVYEVGFKFPSHFAKSFKDLFGILPSEYPRKKG